MKRVFLFLTFLFLALPPVRAETQEIRDLSNRRYFDGTLTAIQNAKRSIFLVMYHAPLDPSNHDSPVTQLFEALIQAKSRGVNVRIILDQEIKTDRSAKGAPMKNLRAYHFLKENGVPVSFDSLGKRTHAKLLVMDEEIVILGSTNWSREALDQNYEANVMLRSPETARAMLEDFKTIELLKPENKNAQTPKAVLRISRNFLLDKNKGPHLLDQHAERAFQLYLFLLSKSSPREKEKESLQLDYEETAKVLGLDQMPREAYRRQMIKVLKKLDRDFRLIHFQPKYGGDAFITLTDPLPEKDYFEIPQEFFSWGWLRLLSLRAIYSLLVLYDQNSYPRTSPVIEVGLETLEKRYFASRKTLGDGFRELARRNLIEIQYGRAIDFQKKEFETASYVVLPFYDPPARDQELKKLEAMYGKDAFQQAAAYAAAFFKENDPETIQTIMGLRWTYSPEWLDLAMKEVILKKSVGNPARSLPYLIGILKAWKEKGRPAFSPS